MRSQAIARHVISGSEAQTADAGRSLAPALDAGDVILLYGDLGAGKTAFVRGVAEGLGIAPNDVTSPTFTLIQEYRGGRLPLHHVDLYRLHSMEVGDLGLDEITMENGVTAIEWPDRLPEQFEQAIEVRMEHREGDVRDITIASGPGRLSVHSDR